MGKLVRQETGNPAMALAHEYLSPLWKSMPAYDAGVKLSTQMHYGEQTKHVVWTFQESKEPLEIIHITDVQYGHVGCKLDRVIEYRDWVLASPRRYMIWGGDMVDAWAMWSPGTPWENHFNSQSQVFRLAEIWGPARHRILGYVGGNHERRAIPAFGDLGVLIATLLQIPYSRGIQMVDIRFGKHQPFKNHLFHGRGAARTKGAKINMIHEVMKRSDAQMIWVGHLHDVLSTFDWRMVRDKQDKIIFQKQGGAMSNSFLEFWNSYAEVGGMNPSDVMMALVKLYPDGKWKMEMQ